MTERKCMHCGASVTNPNPHVAACPACIRKALHDNFPELADRLEAHERVKRAKPGDLS